MLQKYIAHGVLRVGTIVDISAVILRLRKLSVIIYVSHHLCQTVPMALTELPVTLIG